MAPLRPVAGPAVERIQKQSDMFSDELQKIINDGCPDGHPERARLEGEIANKLVERQDFEAAMAQRTVAHGYDAQLAQAPPSTSTTGSSPPRSAGKRKRAGGGARPPPPPTGVRVGTNDAPAPPPADPDGEPWPKTKIIVGSDAALDLPGAQACWFVVDGACRRAKFLRIPDRNQQHWWGTSPDENPVKADVACTRGGGHERVRVTVDMPRQVDNSVVGCATSLPVRFPGLALKCQRTRRVMESHAGRANPHHGWATAAGCLSTPTCTSAVGGADKLTWWPNARGMTANPRNFEEPTMIGLFRQLAGLARTTRMARATALKVYFLVFHCTIAGERQDAANPGAGAHSGHGDHHAVNGDPDVVMGRRGNGDPVYGKSCATKSLFGCLVCKCGLEICQVMCFDLFNFGHVDGCGHRGADRVGKARNDCRPPSNGTNCVETQRNADTVAGEVALVAGWLDAKWLSFVPNVIAMGTMGAASLCAHLTKTAVKAGETIGLTITPAAHICVANVVTHSRDSHLAISFLRCG